MHKTLTLQKQKTISKAHSILTLLIIVVIIACNDTSRPTINERLSKPRLETMAIEAYTNRDLSLLSIVDKAWVVNNYGQFETDTLVYRTFFEKTLTLVRNKGATLPLRQISSKRIRLVYWGDFPVSFSERLAYYASVETLSILDFDWKTVTASDVILLVINQKDISKKTFDAMRVKIQQRKAQVVLINFEKVKNLLYFADFPTLLQVYERNAVTEDESVQMIFGGIQAKGQLPIDLSEDLKKGTGDTATAIIRLSYTLPEAAGMSSKRLSEIKNIMERAIRKKATPGGQVLAIKSGKVVYYQSFGHFEYNKNQAVHNLNLYDLASVTKASATTLAIMKLYQDGLLDMEKTLADYVPQSEKSTSRNLKIRHLLTHQTGLPPNPPISKYVRMRDTVSTRYRTYFANQESEEYAVKIDDNLYMKQQVQVDLWQAIYKIRLARKRNYLYSDVNFALLQQVSEAITGERLDTYLEQHIYNRLGLNRLLFNPLGRFPRSEIVPTALDKRWRHQLLQGEVHDEFSALSGGVSGNAGLFADANDLAILYQLLLNKGNYGGEQIFTPATIDYFVYQKQSGHRGLGFDRKGAGCYPSASKRTFGHSGYTGTCVWADPDKELIYVFLSNRVNPDPDNEGLMTLNTRMLVHRAIYHALL